MTARKYFLRKTVCGETTAFTYDRANQLRLAHLPDGTTKTFAYDAAGRMIREGRKSYDYAWLDKVVALNDGSTTTRYGYHADGQIAEVQTTTKNTKETFFWDGLALIKRNDVSYTIEPHVNGGNAILSTTNGHGSTRIMFNDMLGTTLGMVDNGKLKLNNPTAFGEAVSDSFYTGKPHVPGLGYAFLFRNYRPDLGKWQTSDPLGYPDGWNNLAYGNNLPTSGVDQLGAEWVEITHTGHWDTDPYTVDFSPSVQIFYIGNASGGNQGVAILDSPDHPFDNLVSHFPATTPLPAEMVQNDWFNISIGTRKQVVMTSYSISGDHQSFLGNDDDPTNDFWFSLYSITGNARYEFTYTTREWREEPE